jgi:AmmeMemoRadiSam system protein A
MFSSVTQHILLNLARTSIERYLQTGERVDATKFFPNRLEYYEKKRIFGCFGVFVTLKKNGWVRGRMGTIDPEGWLCKSIAKYAILAAVSDPKFDMVTLMEMGTIDIEISILTSLQSVGSYEEVELGKHGVRIRKDGRSAAFLPSLPIERRWNLTKMMERLCIKASLDKDAYKKADAILEVFEAEELTED